MARNYKLVLFEEGLCPQEGQETRCEIVTFEAGSIDEARAKAKDAYIKRRGSLISWDEAFLVTAFEEIPRLEWDEESYKIYDERDKREQDQRDRAEYERLKTKFGPSGG